MKKVFENQFLYIYKPKVIFKKINSKILFNIILFVRSLPTLKKKKISVFTFYYFRKFQKIKFWNFS